MMTRKDYVATAEILDNFIASMPVEYQDECDRLVIAFGKMFAEDNPRFMAEVFYDACYRHID